MLSRVADCVYWMSRYIERAENVARFVDVNQAISLGGTPQWAPLVYASGDEDLFKELYGEFTAENVLRFLLFDDRNLNSILSCAKFARENARTIRETLSVTLWESINRFYLRVRDGLLNIDPILQNPHQFLERVKRSSHQTIGVTEATLSHGEAWHFSRVGRLLERADKTSRILDVKYFLLLGTPSTIGVSGPTGDLASGSTLDVVQWSALLESTSALHAYRKEFGRIEPKSVAQFLIFDKNFPRALRSCIQQAQSSLHEITGTPLGEVSDAATEQFAAFRNQLRSMTIDDVFSLGLHEFIDDFQSHVNELGQAMFRSFFESRPMTQVAENSQ